MRVTARHDDRYRFTRSILTAAFAAAVLLSAAPECSAQGTATWKPAKALGPYAKLNLNPVTTKAAGLRSGEFRLDGVPIGGDVSGGLLYVPWFGSNRKFHTQRGTVPAPAVKANVAYVAASCAWWPDSEVRGKATLGLQLLGGAGHSIQLVSGKHVGEWVSNAANAPNTTRVANPDKYTKSTYVSRWRFPEMTVTGIDVSYLLSTRVVEGKAGDQPIVELFGITLGYEAPDGTLPEPTAVATRFTVQAGEARVAPGATIRVPVSLARASNVANLNFEVRYDSSVVVFDGEAGKGDLLGGAFLVVNGRDAGLVRGAFAVSSGISGTGVIATLPFRAVGAPGRKTALTVSVTAANGPTGAAIPADRIHGSIEIVGPPATPVPPPPTRVPTPPPPTVPAGIAGDCNGDGRVTEVDALCALRISVGLQASDSRMDVNGDGIVTSLDAAKILRKAVGKE